MAHFAEINDSNVVVRILVVDDKDTQDEDGNEVESVGAKFLSDTFYKQLAADEKAKEEHSKNILVETHEKINKLNKTLGAIENKQVPELFEEDKRHDDGDDYYKFAEDKTDEADVA